MPGCLSGIFFRNAGDKVGMRWRDGIAAPPTASRALGHARAAVTAVAVAHTAHLTAERWVAWRRAIFSLWTF